MTADPVTAILDQLAAHAEKLDRLDAVAELAARLDAQLAAMSDASSRSPAPARRWWKLDGPDRDNAIATLRNWVDQVYRPGYGQLAAGLAPCWDQHPLCLYILDWLSELWSVLYLRPERTAGTLAGQAEWHTRLLSATAEQLARETRGCRHSAAPYRVTGGRGSRP